MEFKRLSVGRGGVPLNNPLQVRQNPQDRLLLGSLLLSLKLDRLPREARKLPRAGALRLRLGEARGRKVEGR